MFFHQIIYILKCSYIEWFISWFFYWNVQILKCFINGGRRLYQFYDYNSLIYFFIYWITSLQVIKNSFLIHSFPVLVCPRCLKAYKYQSKLKSKVVVIILIKSATTVNETKFHILKCSYIEIFIYWNIHILKCSYIEMFIN